MFLHFYFVPYCTQRNNPCTNNTLVFVLHMILCSTVIPVYNMFSHIRPSYKTEFPPNITNNLSLNQAGSYTEFFPTAENKTSCTYPGFYSSEDQTHWWLICDSVVTHWWIIGDSFMTHWWFIGDSLVTHWWFTGEVNQRKNTNVMIFFIIYFCFVVLE